MGYIGQEPSVGGYELLTISGTINGSNTSFTLNKAPASANHLMVIINGVLQIWGTGYTVSGTTLTTTSAPATGSTMACLMLGHVYDIGKPTDGTVDSRSITSGDLGIGTNAPNRKLHVSGASKEISLTNTSMSTDRKTMNWFLASDKAQWRMLNDAGTAGGGTATLDWSGNMMVQGYYAKSTGNDILQQVFVVDDTTQPALSGNLSSFTEISTNWRLAITPKSASSNLIFQAFFVYNQYGGTQTWILHHRFYDVTNSSAVAIGPSLSNRNRVSWSGRHPHADSNDPTPVLMMGRQSSANTTARTYTLHFRSESTGTTSVKWNHSTGDYSTYGWTTQMVFSITEVL